MSGYRHRKDGSLRDGSNESHNGWYSEMMANTITHSCVSAAETGHQTQVCYLR